MASAPFSTAALAQSQSPAGARSSGRRVSAGSTLDLRSAMERAVEVAVLVGSPFLGKDNLVCHSLVDKTFRVVPAGASLAQHRVALGAVRVRVRIVQVIV